MTVDTPSDAEAGVPLVSVVVPVYNGGAVLRESIDSALAQTYPRLEVIVVDDGSSDDTPDVIARYGDRIISVRQSNQGLAAARNAGMRRVSGEYIAWLDHDDTWMPEKISLQMAFMQQHPECSVIGTNFSAFDADGFFDRSHAAVYYANVGKTGLAGIFPDRASLSTRDLAPRPEDMPESLPVYMGRIERTLVWGNCLHPPTVLMSRAAAVQAGFCDRRFGSDVDYEYFLRLARIGPAAFIDHPLIRYRYSPGQLSSDKNLAKIAVSLVTVLDDVASRDPTLRDDPDFRRRVARAHLQAAHALADTKREPALRHLVQSLATAGVVDASTAVRTAAKLLLPHFLVEGYRSVLAARRTASGR